MTASSLMRSLCHPLLVYEYLALTLLWTRAAGAGVAAECPESCRRILGSSLAPTVASEAFKKYVRLWAS